MSSANEFTSTLVSPRYGWHCTTKKKLEKYKASGRIIAPVRFWPNRETAERWCKRTGREIIVKIELEAPSFPLPDHKPAYWCPQDVLVFENVGF
jgi:hypothetical protein